MTNEEIAVKIAEHGKEIGSLKHRVGDLEEITDTIHKLTLSVQELASNIQNMIKEQERYGKTQERMFQRIETLERKPAKRWESLIEKAISALIGGIIGYVLVRLGLN